MIMKSKVILEQGRHHNNDVVFLIFPKDAELIAAIKTLGVARGGAKLKTSGLSIKANLI